MKNIIEVIKANKKAIGKKALIVGGTIAGLVLVAQVLPKATDEEFPETVLEPEDEEDEVSDNVTKI